MKCLVGFFLLFVSLSSSAQQDPLYAQYMLNPLLINPAYTGLSNNLNIMAGYRAQWTGLEGHPQTISATAHTSLVENKVGLGVLFSKDQIGSTTGTESSITFSYKLYLGQSIFSFGMQTGIQNYKTDFSELSVYDPSDYAFAGNENETRLNIGTGAIFKNERVFVGFSIPRLLPSTFENGGQKFDLYNQHYYLMASYVVYLTDHIRFLPAVLARGVKGSPTSIDLSCKVNISAIYTAGIFTRNFNSYGILFQTLLSEQIRLGYVFEVPSNKSVGTKFPTHEIRLGLRLPVFGFHENKLTNF